MPKPKNRLEELSLLKEKLTMYEQRFESTCLRLTQLNAFHQTDEWTKMIDQKNSLTTIIYETKEKIGHLSKNEGYLGSGLGLTNLPQKIYNSFK